MNALTTTEDSPSFNIHRVILSSPAPTNARLKTLLHEDEEWGVGVPAAMAVSDTFMKEAFCSFWNFPKKNGRVLAPGSRLVPKYPVMNVIFLDGRPMGTVTFAPDEVLVVAEVGHDKKMDQFVFRSEGRNYLPIDWDMFELAA